MEFRQMRYAVAVARRKNFTRAAEDVNIAQPALSQQVASLEEELGVRLFERTNRRVALTEAGAAFVERAESIMRDVSFLQEEMHAHAGGLHGRIVIGTYQSISEHILPPLLGRFHAKYPDIELSLREGMATDLLSGVVSHDIDLFIGEPTPTHHQMMQGLLQKPLFKDELGVLVGRNHEYAMRTRVPMSALSGESWITFGTGSSLRERLETLCRDAGFVPRVSIETVDSATLRAIVAEGLGVGLFPRTLAENPGPKVTFLSVTPGPVYRNMSLVHRPHLAPSAARFVDFITIALKAHATS